MIPQYSEFVLDEYLKSLMYSYAWSRTLVSAIQFITGKLRSYVQVNYSRCRVISMEKRNKLYNFFHILFQYASILEKAEENIYKITNILLKSKSKENDKFGGDEAPTSKITIDRMDLVSLTVLKAKGKDLPFEFPSTYGSVILPYFETFQDTIGGEEICVNVSEIFSFLLINSCMLQECILKSLNLFFFY